jgi:hypothetical protein
VGYDRYSSLVALETMNRVYHILRLYVNFFQPSMKLIAKARQGVKVKKFYSPALTPYRRLLKSGVLTEEKRGQLAATYHGLNPALLLQQLNDNLEHLWNLAERSTPQRRKTKDHVTSVTPIHDATMPVG